MRCGDWDVLIFPVVEPTPEYTPVSEFRVKAFRVKDDRYVGPAAQSNQDSVPLVTAVIACLDAEAPFLISVHNWSGKPQFQFQKRDGAEAAQVSTRHVWQVKVTIDGTVKFVGEFGPRVEWPVKFRDTNLSTRGGQQERLRFPPYHAELEDVVFHPYDNRGRIKVEILEGYFNKNPGEEDFDTAFHLLACHNIFSYQYAPIEKLRDSGVAWPGPHDEVLYAVKQRSRGLTPPYQGSQYQYGALPGPVRSSNPQRELSNGSTFLSSSSMINDTSHAPPPTPGYGLPLPIAQSTSRYGMAGYEYRGSYDAGPSQLASPFKYRPFGFPLPGSIDAFEYQPLGCPPQSNVDEQSSRSTSAYSTLSASAMPLHIPKSMPPSNTGHAFFAAHSVPGHPTHKVPDAQMQGVLEMLQSAKFNARTMAPPPLPQRITNAQIVTSTENEDSMTGISRRDASRSCQSDTSMHAGCPDYPDCLAEDEHGRLAHRPGDSTTHAVLRSRKEGGNNDIPDVGPWAIPSGPRLLSDAATSHPPPVTPNRQQPRQPSYSSLGPVDDQPGQKRTRAARLSVSKDGSPVKQDKEDDSKPVRKRVMVAPQDL